MATEIQIKMTDIDSSMIKLLHFRGDGQNNILGVIFNNGDAYIYREVLFSDMIEIMYSPSVGKSFRETVLKRGRPFIIVNHKLEYGMSPLDIL